MNQTAQDKQAALESLRKTLIRVQAAHDIKLPNKGGEPKHENR